MVVAGEHDRGDPESFEVGDRLAAGGFHVVGDGEHAERTSVVHQHDRCLRFGLEAGQHRFQVGAAEAAAFDEGVVPEPIGDAVDGADDAVPGDRVDAAGVA